MIRFSVIIPTFNRKDYLLECLASVFAQTHQAHEIIVVDDGSTDGSIEAISHFGDRVVVQRQQNSGPGVARNRGAEVASGDYLAFLDSDDLWFPWTLATFAELILRYDSPSLVFGHFADFINQDQLRHFSWEQPNAASYPDFLCSHIEGHFCGAGMMVILRAAFVQTQGFAEDFLNSEDHDVALQLGEAPGFLSVSRPITVGHRIHDNNEMADTAKSLRGLSRLVRKEKAHLYPGGSKRGYARKAIISRHVRSAVLGGLRAKAGSEAWRLYGETFGWNLRLGRGLYLIGAPIIAAASVIRSAASS